MKKLLFIAVALMAVFAFSQGAMASLNEASDPALCLTCLETGDYPVGKGTATSECGCDIDLVECNEQSDCDPFDYDEPYGTPRGPGWCPSAGTNCCQVIFYICECGDTPNETFSVGTTIGIRMTILVNGANGRDLGAYWAEDNSAAIGLFTAATKSAACGVTTDKAFVNNTYYTDSSATTTAAPYAGPICALVNANKATVVRSTTAADGFMVTATEANPVNPLNYWKIDVGAMRIDPTLIAKCALISVKIELLDSLGSGICPTCAPICECIYDVARACCDCGYVPVVTTYDCCIYFPYVLQGEEGWMTGIAVSNLTYTGGSWTATFTFTDKEGTVWTHDFTFTQGTVAMSMDAIVAQAGWSPAAGNGWLKIEVEQEGAVIAIDGYQFNLLDTGDLMFGAGVLARECDWHCLHGAE